MVEKERGEELDYQEQIIELIRNGQPFPEALVKRDSQGTSVSPGPNRPESTPGIKMEGGLPSKKE